MPRRTTAQTVDGASSGGRMWATPGSPRTVKGGFSDPRSADAEATATGNLTGLAPSGRALLGPVFQSDCED
jgi:hypothetical protein